MPGLKDELRIIKQSYRELVGLNLAARKASHAAIYQRLRWAGLGISLSIFALVNSVMLYALFLTSSALGGVMPLLMALGLAASVFFLYKLYRFAAHEYGLAQHTGIITYTQSELEEQLNAVNSKAMKARIFGIAIACFSVAVMALVFVLWATLPAFSVTAILVPVMVNAIALLATAQLPWVYYVNEVYSLNTAIEILREDEPANATGPLIVDALTPIDLLELDAPDSDKTLKKPLIDRTQLQPNYGSPASSTSALFTPSSAHTGPQRSSVVRGLDHARIPGLHAS